MRTRRGRPVNRLTNGLANGLLACPGERRGVTLVAGLLLALFAGDVRSVNAPSDVESAPSAAVSANAPSAELAAFKKAIRAKYDLKERAFASHDAETIVTRFYTPDVISVGEGEGVYIGRDQIRPLYQDVVKNNKVKVESVHTFVRGDAGWDWADFHVYPTDGKTAPFTFAILFLWARIEGEWMCKGDFFVNGSLKEGKLTPAPKAP
jgi:ketosteroid isomerase-like protein